MALVLLMPPILVYVVIAGLEEEDLLYQASGGLETYVEVVVTLVTVVLLTPVLIGLGKSMRLYNSIDSVLLEGMIFRPRLTPRFSMDNLAGTCGFIIEFVSHVNSGMTSDYLGFIKPAEYDTWSGNMHMYGICRHAILAHCRRGSHCVCSWGAKELAMCVAHAGTLLTKAVWPQSVANYGATLPHYYLTCATCVMMS